MSENTPIPDIDLEKLDEQEKALLAQVEQIRRKRHEEQERKNREALEAARQAQLTKPIVIRVLNIAGALLVLDSEYRTDVVEVLRTIPGRSYRGARENMVPLAEWTAAQAALTSLPNVTIKYNPGVKEEVDWFLTAPKWLIDITNDGRWLEAKVGPGAFQSMMYQIPGAELVRERKLWKIPLTEGWRLFEALKKEDGVVYTEEAKEHLVKQIEARAKLDKIALMERGEKYKDYDFGVGMKLRPFQEVGCEFIDAAGGRALLADEMGLGKTWQALAYAIKNKLRVVVICPASLKANWSREWRKLSGGDRASVYMGAEPSQYDLVKALTTPARCTIINYDILGRKLENKKVTKDAEGYTHEAHETRYLWAELINMSKPDLVVVDEGHYIKNTDSNRSKAVRTIKAPRVVVMTGTPVLNRPGELWPMLNLISPDNFPAEETFLRQYTYDGRTAKNVDELRQILKTIMIRRLKKDVVAELPPINSINEYHELSEKALKLYRKVEQGVYEQISAYSPSGQTGDAKQITNILAQIQRLKMVCAIDKVDQTAELAQQLYDETESGEKKVIIFTQYKAVAYAIYQRLADDGALCFVRRTPTDFVTADNEERDRLVQEFQNDPKVKYLVVTEKTTKEGHNITAAGHVIFNDLFWTPAGHDQAEGRAYGRLSNLHSINSYYMITDMDGESIEEWIMELLSSKMAMINEVVEGVEGSRDVSVVMELINKMKESMWSRKK